MNYRVRFFNADGIELPPPYSPRIHARLARASQDAKTSVTQPFGPHRAVVYGTDGRIMWECRAETVTPDQREAARWAADQVTRQRELAVEAVLSLAAEGL